MINLSTYKSCVNYESKVVTIPLASANRKTYKIDNRTQKNKISHYKDIDEHVFPNSTCCDHLFIVDNNIKKKALLIELKSDAILRAVEQISESITKLKFSNNEHDVYGRIVATEVHAPKLQSISYIKLDRKLRGEFNGNLKTKSKIFIEQL